MNDTKTQNPTTTYHNNTNNDVPQFLADAITQYGELHGSHVTQYTELPTPFDFYRDHVSANFPALFKGVCSEWPAVKQWSSDSYLIDRMGSHSDISVAATPNGYADVVIGDLFVSAEERTMKFGDFVRQLSACEEQVVKSPGTLSGVEVGKESWYETDVLYAQKQNSVMTSEFTQLLGDVPGGGGGWPFANEAFGEAPDAINFWMGDGRAVSTLHKDFYENIYVVVRGCKFFTLFPPICRPLMPYKQCEVARYCKSMVDQTWSIVTEKQLLDEDKQNSSVSVASSTGPEKSDPKQVNWIDIRRADSMETRDKHPNLSRSTQAYEVRVEAGDMLYLPSLWFHEVAQRHGTIAVNYWYDMKFDHKFVYFDMLEKMSNV